MTVQHVHMVVQLLNAPKRRLRIRARDIDCHAVTLGLNGERPQSKKSPQPESRGEAYGSEWIGPSKETYSFRGENAVLSARPSLPVQSAAMTVEKEAETADGHDRFVPDGSITDFSAGGHLSFYEWVVTDIGVADRRGRRPWVWIGPRGSSARRVRPTS